MCGCLTPGFLCAPNLTSAACLEFHAKRFLEDESKVKKHWRIKYSTGKGHHDYKDTYCCNAVGDVVFAAGTKQLTFWEKKLTEGTWGGDLFCLGCVRSPGESITCHLQTPLDSLHAVSRERRYLERTYLRAQTSQLLGGWSTLGWPGPAGIHEHCTGGTVSLLCNPSKDHPAVLTDISGPVGCPNL